MSWTDRPAQIPNSTGDVCARSNAAFPLPATRRETTLGGIGGLHARQISHQTAIVLELGPMGHRSPGHRRRRRDRDDRLDGHEPRAYAGQRASDPSYSDSGRTQCDATAIEYTLIALPFFFAGIWREWTGDRGTIAKPDVGKHRLYAFLTTEPNGVVEPIHNKAMPVMLMTAKDVELWLTGTIEKALKLQKPAPDKAIVVVNVKKAARWPQGSQSAPRSACGCSVHTSLVLRIRLLMFRHF